MASSRTQSFKIDSSLAFKYNWYYWRFSGVLPSKKFKILYIIYSIILNITVTLLYPLTLLIQLFFAENVKQTLEALNVTVAYICCACKQLNALLMRKNFLAINSFLAKLDSRAQSVKEQRILENMIKILHTFFTVYNVTYMSTAVLSEVSTLFARPRRLMYPAWFPFDWQASNLNYFIANLYQFIGISIAAIEQCPNDTFPAIYMGVLKVHVQALRIRVERIGKDANKTANENYNELIECVRDYQVLRQYCNILQTITSYVLLIQFFVTGFAACITAVYVFFVQGSLFDVVYLVCYFVCVVMEILTSCYYGNELLHESQLITTAIYSCNWPEQTERFKKVMIIFMEFTKQDMSIMAGGLIKVNLESFISLMRSSYSLFAVLIQLT